jgi:hypothetical protein
MDKPKEKTPDVLGRNPLENTQTYTVDGKTFIVEPVFKNDSKDTVGSILMRLMQSDRENAV